MKLLGDLTPQQFLSEYWQQKPLLVRGAVADFKCPVTPEELGGLALEEDVESRLLQEQPEWQLRNGPFKEEDLTPLPDTHWSLLIQEINKHIPEFALLQDRFNFLPNWRLDDVMVSFAPEHGTVGPHADNYDVFLIQGPGRRRWQISHQPCGEEQLIPNLPLRVLKDFKPEQEWVLEQGDMLYLPPGVVHNGVALEDCITISVGFRAPSKVDLISRHFAEILAQMADSNEESFYEDSQRTLQLNPGEIAPADLNAIRTILREIPQQSDDELNHWFGCYTTAVPPGHYLPEPEQTLSGEALKQKINNAGSLWRSEYARFSYIDSAANPTDEPVLFVAGEAFAINREMMEGVKLLCGQRLMMLEEIEPHLGNNDLLQLITELYNLGALYLDDE
ncbi:MAG: cupin domain-containing protein [Gammaproteobacteria bacterium]|nr:cupin domain-containing protein [Gammaproteobacteria bacterium]